MLANYEVGKLFPLVVRSVSELHKGTSSSLIGYKYRKVMQKSRTTRRY